MWALILTLISAAPGDAPFVVASANDEPISGKLLRLTPDFTATVTSRTGETSLKDTLSLRRTRPLPAFPTGRQLLTANGDRIAGELVGSEKDSLQFMPALLATKETPWLVPISNTAAVWLTDTPADTPPDPSRYAWTEGNKNRDVVRLQNGDIARGILVGFVPEAARPTFRFRPDMGEARELPANSVAAVVFNPQLAKPRKPKGPFCRVVLTDGSRISLNNAAIADNTLKAETLFGQQFELPLDAVVSLDVFQGKATYLSDLKPSKVEQAGFLGAAWPWTADRNVRGLQLRLSSDAGESSFDKGLGTHPRTVLTYALGGKYQRFEALVGLDPDSGDRGRVNVRVRVDGKEQPIPGLAPLSGSKPIPVRVDVTGAKELTLELDFGPTGGVRADVNWADARLIE